MSGAKPLSRTAKTNSAKLKECLETIFRAKLSIIRGIWKKDSKKLLANLLTASQRKATLSSQPRTRSTRAWSASTLHRRSRVSWSAASSRPWMNSMVTRRCSLKFNRRNLCADECFCRVPRVMIRFFTKIIHKD